MKLKRLSAVLLVAVAVLVGPLLYVYSSQQVKEKEARAGAQDQAVPFGLKIGERYILRPPFGADVLSRGNVVVVLGQPSKNWVKVDFGEGVTGWVNLNNIVAVFPLKAQRQGK